MLYCIVALLADLSGSTVTFCESLWILAPSPPSVPGNAYLSFLSRPNNYYNNTLFRSISFIHCYHGT